MSTYDPVSTATSLAESYIYTRQYQLDVATNKVQSQVTALNSLKSSLTTFTNALTAVTAKGSVIAQTATVSDSTAASASVSAAASPGIYSFEVEKLATAQQSLYEASDLGILDGVKQDDGSVKWPDEQPQVVVSLGDGGFFTVNLSDADTDNDGKLSVTEIARAINASSQGKVSAAVLNQGETQKLLLNSTSTGKDNAFQIHVLDRSTPDELSKEDIQRYLTPEASATDSDVNTPPSGRVVNATKMLSQAEDSLIWLGGKGTGESVTSSTNTYTGIEGLTVNFKADTSSAFTVTVAKDESTTQSNMQKLVDAYNTVVTSIDKLTASGNAESGAAAGALANDSSIRSLRNQLSGLLRTSVDGVSLTDFGISANRDGTISLDSTRFAKKVASNPDALGSLLGQTNSLEYKRAGVLGSLQTYVESWTKSAGGLLQSRQDSLAKQQAQFTKQQLTIDTMYESAYQRYVKQFSALASLEDQMSSTTNMLAAMFASEKD